MRLTNLGKYLNQLNINSGLNLTEIQTAQRQSCTLIIPKPPRAFKQNRLFKVRWHRKTQKLS